MLARHQTDKKKKREKNSKQCEIHSIQMSCSAPGLSLPQVYPPPQFALYSSQLAIALYLSRTPPPERIEIEEEKGKKERNLDPGVRRARDQEGDTPEKIRWRHLSSAGEGKRGVELM